MKILRREEIGNSIYWQVLGPYDTYNVTYNIYTGKWTCSCKAFIFGRECSHIWKCREEDGTRKTEDVQDRRSQEEA